VSTVVAFHLPMNATTLLSTTNSAQLSASARAVQRTPFVEVPSTHDAIMIPQLYVPQPSSQAYRFPASTVTPYVTQPVQDVR